MGGNWTDTIDIVDRFGERVRLSGPGMYEQGYFLAPQSTGLLDDAPVKTIWHKTMFGMSYSGMEWERREQVWTVNIGYDDLGIDPDREPDEWHMLYDDWRRKFHFDQDTQIIYGAADGERMLHVRMIERAKPFSTHAFEGKDPRLWNFGSVVMTTASEFPFYIGPSERYEWEFTGTGTVWTRLPHYNPSDVPIWPTYEVTAQARYHIPDYSWGNEYYGRGQADEDKIVPTPYLETGEESDIHTRPDQETYQSANDAPVGLRAKGKDFEYPIPPDTGLGVEDPDDEGAVFMVTEVVDGGVLTAEYPRWYSSPFSRPRLTRPIVVSA
jgi:hypothetical protein